MGDGVEKRQAYRVPTRFETLSTAEDPQDPATAPKQGVAMLTDISYTGAQLRRTALNPPLGAKIKVQIFLPGSPGVYFELEGEVVRHTTNGFAIRYDRPSPEICRLVDDAASLV